MKQDNLASNTRLAQNPLPLVCALATTDEVVLSAAASVVARGNETPSSAETVAGAWMLAEVDGTSLDALSGPPTTAESVILISGMGFEPAPEKYKKEKTDC